jgi:quercetin dioxygenase-like cupin family protein
MPAERVFQIATFLQPSDGEPIRSIVTESAPASIVAWFVKPGQCIRPHRHPHGQDTWTVLEGGGAYQVDDAGHTVLIAAGDVVVASAGSVHGVLNTGMQPLIFVSVVCPAAAGFVPV